MTILTQCSDAVKKAASSPATLETARKVTSQVIERVLLDSPEDLRREFAAKLDVVNNHSEAIKNDLENPVLYLDKYRVKCSESQGTTFRCDGIEN